MPGILSYTRDVGTNGGGDRGRDDVKINRVESQRPEAGEKDPNRAGEGYNGKRRILVVLRPRPDGNRS